MKLIFALFMLLLVGCPSGSSSSSSSSSETSAAKRPLAGAKLVADGTSWQFKARDKGYVLEAGDKKIIVDVESDRVKVEDGSGKTLAKVKTKDAGFKVYGGDDNAVLRAKRKGDRFKLKRLPADEELDDGGVEVEKNGEMWAVKRKGELVAEISASVPKHAASFLAVTEVTFEQRVGMVVHALELPQ
ncbi:MAG TPA: hypothetical protein VFB62_20880 [Polyangiaceae bacterium]|jgi:hypothetical protein|nr:hypothetical protein [Polyangiaceae bacterium]